MLKTKIVLAGTGVLITLLIQGCGRKGPLFMPQAAPAQPVPAVVKLQPASAVAPAAPTQNITPSN
jgi:predicted small lipoprotein YifL